MANENRQMNREAAQATALYGPAPIQTGLFGQEIDIFALLHMLLQHIWALVVCAIIGLTAAGAYTYYFMPNMYRATATIYIFSNTVSSEMQLGTQMIGDLKIISSSDVVLQQVVDDLNLTVSARQLKGMVSVNNPSGSHMLQISAVSTDPHQAMEISNSLSERMREQISTVMNTSKPSVVERATVPGAPYAPNLYKNAAIGAAAGLALAAGVLVLLYMLDDTIKSKEDIKRYLQMETLAELPYVKEVERSTAKARRKRFRMRKKEAKRYAKGDKNFPQAEVIPTPPRQEPRVIEVPENPELVRPAVEEEQPARPVAERASRTERPKRRFRP